LNTCHIIQRKTSNIGPHKSLIIKTCKQIADTDIQTANSDPESHTVMTPVKYAVIKYAPGA